jgi:hypothetical protein
MNIDEKKRTATDEFGNQMNFDRVVPFCFIPPLLQLLVEEQSQEIEIFGLDKGYLFYKLERQEDYFVLTETRVYLHGYCGKFEDKLKMRELAPLKEFFKSILQEASAEDC